MYMYKIYMYIHVHVRQDNGICLRQIQSSKGTHVHVNMYTCTCVYVSSSPLFSFSTTIIPVTYWWSHILIVLNVMYIYIATSTILHITPLYMSQVKHVHGTMVSPPTVCTRNCENSVYESIWSSMWRRKSQKGRRSGDSERQIFNWSMQACKYDC